MQSNDLNIFLASGNWNVDDFQNPESLISKIRMSPVHRIGTLVTEEDIKTLSETKIPPSEELLTEVRKAVSYYENLGKSRRWIRRYIKRKFNIVEY